MGVSAGKGQRTEFEVRVDGVRSDSWIRRYEVHVDGLGFGVRAGERTSQLLIRSAGVAVSLIGSPAGKLRGGRPGRLAPLICRRSHPPAGPGQPFGR